MINYLRCGWGSLAGAILTGPMFMADQPPPPPPPPEQPPYYGQPPYGGGYAQIPNYLPWAIVITVIAVFCCPTSILGFIFGIIAIVKAASANSRRAAGDYAGAVEDANAARTWLIVAGVLTLLALIANVLWGGIFMRQLERYQPNQPFPRQRI